MWNEVRLGDAVEQITVGYVGSMSSEYTAEGIPFLRSLNIQPYRVTINDLKFISPQFHQKLSKSRLTPGDVVIIRTGNTGIAAVIPDWLSEANCSDLVIIRTGNCVDSRFLAYYLNSAVGQHSIRSRNVGTVQLHFNVQAAQNMPIVLPPLSEQRAIAHILGSLDDKIELNRRMNATLEAIARAIFQSWFVDFDPVHAKARGEQPFGMDAETAALFPDSFEESPLGIIPAGWEISSLGELFPGDRDCVLTGPFGSHLHAHDYREEGVPLILVKHVGYGYIVEDDMPLVGEHKIPEMARYRLQLGDIVFTRVGAVGRTAYIYPRYVGWMISGQTLRVRISNSSVLNSRYLAQIYIDPTFVKMVESFALGTTRPSLNTNILSSFRFLVPPIEIQNRYSILVESIDHRVQNDLSENRTLAELRDTLLPRLVSGELRLPSSLSLHD